MIKVLAMKELLDQLSSPKFVFLFAVSTVLVVFSLYTGSGSYVGARSEYQATQRLSRSELANRRSYDEVSQFGVKVARPPSALSGIAGGVSSALGRSARVRPEVQPELSPAPLADTPVLAVLGELDFNVVARVFLSLFVLLLTYTAVAGEKEGGTLKAVLANPVPRTQFLLGKSLGLFGTLKAAVIVPSVLGLLVMKVGFGVSLTGGEWVRLAAIGCTTLLYLLEIFAIGLLVSTMTSRSAVAFLVLLLVWVAFVEVIPKASPMLAGQIRPAPSFASLQSERDRIQAEYQQGFFSGMSHAFAHTQGQVNTPAEADSRQRAIDSTMNRLRDSLGQLRDAKLLRLEEGYRNQQDAMTRLSLVFARFSPAKTRESHANLRGHLQNALAHGRVVADAGADCCLMCADYCFNAGPFLSPKMFREWVTPYLTEFVAGMRDMGYYTVKHTDGDIMPILDQLVEARPHALHSIDPQAGVDLKVVKQMVGDKIALCGNVHCGMLHNGTMEQVIADSKRALRDGMPGGGFFFCTSNTPFKGMPLENYLAMLDVRKEFGRYK